MIYLVDGSPALLTSMSKGSQKYAYDELVKMGVEVRLNKQVKDYINDTVVFADGETIQTRFLLWTAGVTGKLLDGFPPDSYGRGNRLLVDEYNKVKGTNNIYAIGDACVMTSDRNFPEGHPQLAQVALQQGKNLAENLKASFHDKPLKPFTYHDKGSMAIIGRSKAVADLPKPKMHFNGYIAWAAWLFIHLFSLITYRNRIKTMYNWAVAYFTKDQSLRMIIRPEINQEKTRSRKPSGTSGIHGRYPQVIDDNTRCSVRHKVKNSSFFSLGSSFVRQCAFLPTPVAQRRWVSASGRCISSGCSPFRFPSRSATIWRLPATHW